MNKVLRDQLREIARLGFVVKRVERQGNDHKRAYITHPSVAGEHFVVLGCSPRRGADGGAYIVRDRLNKLLRRTA